jgi:hypothetical protein
MWGSCCRGHARIEGRKRFIAVYFAQNWRLCLYIKYLVLFFMLYGDHIVGVPA